MNILYAEITRNIYLWNIKINKPEQDVVGDQLILLDQNNRRERGP